MCYIDEGLRSIVSYIFLIYLFYIFFNFYLGLVVIMFIYCFCYVVKVLWECV